MTRLTHSCVLLLAAAAAPALSLTSIHVVEVDNSAGGMPLDGFTTYDIRIQSTGQVWTGSQLRINLNAGTFFRSANGSPNGAAPNPLLFPLFPDLEFDTYLAEGNGGFGAVDFGGDPSGTFPADGDSQLNQFWLPNLGNLYDLSDFNTVRVTVSDNNAQSTTLRYLASVDGEIHPFRYDGPFSRLSGDADGHLFGDYNVDGRVGQGDLDLVLLNWGLIASGGPAGWLAADQFDGAVGQNDLDVVLINWGNGAGPPIPPEPWQSGPGAGDFDDSGVVSTGDLDLVLLDWGGDVLPFDESKVGGTFDGLVSQNEFDAVALNWGNASEPSGGQLPEPGACAALIVALTLVPRWRSGRALV